MALFKKKKLQVTYDPLTGRTYCIPVPIKAPANLSNCRPEGTNSTGGRKPKKIRKPS